VELKEYIVILWRRWWLVVLVPLIVLIGVLYQAVGSQPAYTATTQLAVTRLPQQPATPEFRYDEYYNYLASEYMIDDMVNVVRGNVFAEDVSKTIAATNGVEIAPGEIQGAIDSSRRNRILTVNVTAAKPERAMMIAAAVATTLERNGTAYFGFNPAERGAIIKTVQQPLSASANTEREWLIMALEVMVALFAGVLLAFLVEYLDDTLRSPEMVSAALRIPVIGVIPGGRDR
jgi:capsular polysaccharide biosynthesis protein